MVTFESCTVTCRFLRTSAVCSFLEKESGKKKEGHKTEVESFTSSTLYIVHRANDQKLEEAPLTIILLP